MTTNFTPLPTHDIIPQQEETIFSNSKNTNKKKRKYIFFVLEGLVIILAFIFFLLLKNSSKPSEKTSIPFTPTESTSYSSTITITPTTPPGLTLTPIPTEAPVGDYNQNEILREEYKKQGLADAVIFSYLPLPPNDHLFTLSSDFAPKGSKYIRSFTVTSKARYPEEAQQDFEEWLTSIGITPEQRKNLIIEFK